MEHSSSYAQRETPLRSLTSAIGEDPRSVQEVLDRLHGIQLVTGDVGAHITGSCDGLGAFNHLYARITQQVLLDLQQETFQSPEFLATLDIEFAKRYFNALRSHEADPRAAPRSWSTLLSKRTHDDIRELQFATAGVNTHVNFDLPFALLTTWQILGFENATSPTGRRQYADYLRINTVFRKEMTSLRRELEEPKQRRLDLGGLSHLISRMSDEAVVLDREAAWRVAEHVHAHLEVLTEAQGCLDELTAKVNEVLLHS